VFTSQQAYEAIGRAHETKSEPIVGIADLLRDYAEKSEALYAAGAGIRSRIDAVDKRLDEDYHVNSLGELQRNAQDYDRLCGERQAAAYAVVKFTQQMLRWGVVTAEALKPVLEGTPFANLTEDK
jgi:hypothetical protein